MTTRREKQKGKTTDNVPSGEMQAVSVRIGSALKHLGVRDLNLDKTLEQSETANREESRLLSSPSLLKDKLRRSIAYVADRTLASLVEAEAKGRATMLDRKNAALTVAICTDKLLVLAGEPTARLALETKPSPGDLASLADRLARVAGLVALENASVTASLAASVQLGHGEPSLDGHALESSLAGTAEPDSPGASLDPT